MLDTERWESGDAVRVNGEVVPVEEEGEAERMERTGENAVLRRRREWVELRRGVKDWKRFWRVGETILIEELGWKKVDLNGWL